MKKAIVLSSTDEKVKDFTKKMESLSESYKTRMKFIDKQHQDLYKKAGEDAKVVWEDLKAYMIEKKYLPDDYSEEKHALHFDMEAGCIYMMDAAGQASSIREFLSTPIRIDP